MHPLRVPYAHCMGMAPCVPAAMARPTATSTMPKITAPQPSTRPASARPAPCSPVRRHPVAVCVGGPHRALIAVGYRIAMPSRHHASRPITRPSPRDTFLHRQRPSAAGRPLGSSALTCNSRTSRCWRPSGQLAHRAGQARVLACRAIRAQQIQLGAQRRNSPFGTGQPATLDGTAAAHSGGSGSPRLAFVLVLGGE